MQRLAVLYTANLAGRLDLLPRLFTVIRQVKAIAGGPTALIDLGNSCSPEAWECAATEGRAVLSVLDAMGYAAARLTEAESRRLTVRAVEHLRDMSGMIVCAAGGALPTAVAWSAGKWRLALHAGPETFPAAQLILRVGNACRLDSDARALWTAFPPGDSLGVAYVTFDEEDRPVEAAFRRQVISGEARPDPTVAAAVDFVRDEARRYARFRQKGDDCGAG